jgi:hypothetical protein
MPSPDEIREMIEAIRSQQERLRTAFARQVPRLDDLARQHATLRRRLRELRTLHLEPGSQHFGLDFMYGRSDN